MDPIYENLEHPIKSYLHLKTLAFIRHKLKKANIVLVKAIKIIDHPYINQISLSPEIKHVQKFHLDNQHECVWNVEMLQIIVLLNTITSFNYFHGNQNKM